MKVKRNSVYGAILGVISIIALLAVMNYYAAGYDRALGIGAPSFLTVSAYVILDITVVIFIVFWVADRLKKRKVNFYFIKKP